MPGNTLIPVGVVLRPAPIIGQTNSAAPKPYNGHSMSEGESKDLTPAPGGPPQTQDCGAPKTESRDPRFAELDAMRERVLVRGGQRILIRTKPRFVHTSSQLKHGEPSAASSVCDERSDRRRRTALDPAPRLAGGSVSAGIHRYRRKSRLQPATICECWPQSAPAT